MACRQEIHDACSCVVREGTDPWLLLVRQMCEDAAKKFAEQLDREIMGCVASEPLPGRCVE